MNLIWAISRRHVLTAAHCTKTQDGSWDATKNQSLITVVIGVHNTEWVEQKVSWFLLIFLFQRSWEQPASRDCQGPLANRLFLGYALWEEKDQWCCSVGTKDGRQAFPKGEDQRKCKFSQVLPICLPSATGGKSGGKDYQGEVWTPSDTIRSCLFRPGQIASLGQRQQ